MALEFTPKTWKDGEEGGTPIVAEELNRIEQGINQLTEMLNKVKSYVYSNPVANLLSTDNELPLAASMGKQLKGEIDALNTDLANYFQEVTLEVTFGEDGYARNIDTGIPNNYNIICVYGIATSESFTFSAVNGNTVVTLHVSNGEAGTYRISFIYITKRF